MLSTRCVKIKLRAGSLPEVRAWAEELNRRKNEVMDTLHAEGVTLESVFLLTDGGEHSLIYVMRADNFEMAAEVAKRSVSDIDEYHKHFKKSCWVGYEPLDVLVDFSV